MSTHKERCDKARELGAEVEGGINWTWANSFPTKEIAQQFINTFPDMETTGIYADNTGPTFSVRFR